MQVELAQLRYRLPRLRGRGIELSQQGGGIGTRGPGETQLEVDRRRIQSRITKLERDLVAARPDPRHATQGPAPPLADDRRARRLHERGEVHAAQPAHRRRACWSRTGCSPRSIPRTRRLRLPGGEMVLLSDTVGFVRRLPAPARRVVPLDARGGRATPTSCVHLVDASDPEVERADRRGARGARRDRRGRASPSSSCSPRPTRSTPESLERARRGAPRTRSPCPARTGEGVAALLDRLGDRLRALEQVVELHIPYDRGDVLAGAAPRRRGARRGARGGRHARAGPAARRGRRSLRGLRHRGRPRDGDAAARR